jgi:peroxiredoxin
VTNGDYPDVAGEFIGVETKEIQKGYEPPIHDFTIEQQGEDFASLLMQEAKLLVLVAYDLAKSDYEAFERVKEVTDKAIEQGYKVIGMSASNEEWTDKIIEEYNLGFEFYFTDETTLKTIVRSNPGLLTLERGTITQKVHYNDIEDLEFN